MDSPRSTNHPDNAVIRLDNPHLAQALEQARLAHIPEPQAHIPEPQPVGTAALEPDRFSPRKPAGEPIGWTAGDEQLQHHASRIAAQLRREQQHLDARESEFHARVAQLEADLRLYRLRQIERDEEIDQRTRQLDDQERRLCERATDLAIAEDTANRHRRPNSSPQAGEQQELRRVIADWQERIRELDTQERQMQAQRADLVRDRQRLDADRTMICRLREDQTHAHDAERERLRAQAELRAGELNDRESRLERREQSVRQMHDDLSRLYRGAIESQLCTEELWSQLQSQQPAAELTARLATLRQQLAEEFQLSEQYQLDLQQQLQEARDAIDAESQSMAHQQAELREWFYRRQQEMERHARELLRRETEINAQEANFRSAEQHWDQQRREFESEIRRLRRLSSFA